MTREEGKKIVRIMKRLLKPCENDAISRQAVAILLNELARAISDKRCRISRGRSTTTIMLDILDLSPVKPQEPKTGHWINIDATHSKCDRCGAVFEIASENGEVNYCPNCGARMFEPQERGV